MKRSWMAAALLAVLALGIFAPLTPVRAGSLEVTGERLIAWSNGDSTQQASDWYPIDKSNRVFFRMWSEHLAYVANTDAEADSAFTDSLSGVIVLFADSVSCCVTGRAGQSVAFGVDTVAATMAAAGDTANGRHIMVSPWPVNKVLRSAVTGTGRYMNIAPILPNQGAAVAIDPAGIINAKYVRILYTPVRRATSATVLATVPHRVTGLRNFRIYASRTTFNK